MVERSIRNLLLALGVSRTAASMITPNMVQSPAVTDPKSPHIMMVVGHIQDVLNGCGYRLARTGYLDAPTADALEHTVGPGWERMTWADVIAGVLATARMPAVTNPRLAASQVPDVTFADSGDGLGGMPLGLPDVPGGLVTYAVAGYLLYRHLKKRK